MTVLAVDGGNSKTDVALVAGDGSLLAHARGPLSSPHHLGLEACVDVLQRLVDEVGLDGPAEVAQVLLAGIDFPEEEDRLHEALSPLGWADRMRVGNDTFAVLRAGTERGWGVAITCGAGINCVGVGPDGRHVRFPALGEITGDWGGGQDVGTTALWSAARSEDGRGPKTVLERIVPAYFGLDSALAVGRAIHVGELSQKRLVELAPAVVAAAADDPVAAGIVDRLADEVVALARAALFRLDLVGEHVEVLVGGGLMRSNDARLLGRIESGLVAVSRGAELRQTSAPPVVGAALLGLDQVEAGAGAQSRLREELTSAVERIETKEVVG
jgi:N-acetylglucosamine kinase-like BadF-type ATPase